MVVKQRYDDKIYKLYIAEAARATVVGLGGATMPSLSEVLDPKPKDTRTGDEIAADIINSLFAPEENPESSA